MATAQIKAEITAVDKASAVLNNVSNSFSKMLKVTAASMAAATAGAVAFGVSSVKAYAEAEKAGKQLQHAVLNVTKATKEQLKQTEDLADALERKGVLDADNIKMGLAQLSTFGLSNRAVQDLGGSLADLAVNQYGVNATGEQLSDTANMIAKALNGQFGILEKSGIRFTEAQKAMIKYGTETEKVTAINEGFAQNLKYTNDVALDTTEGKLAKLGVAFENIKESIGAVLVDALTPLADDLSKFVASDQFKKWLEDVNVWLATNIPKAIAWLKDVGLPALKDIFDLLWPVVRTLADWFIKLVTFMKDHEWVFWSLVAVLGALKVAFALKGALEAFSATIGGVKLVFLGFKALLAMPMALPAIGVAAAVASLATVIAAAINVRNVINDVMNEARAKVKATSDAATEAAKNVNKSPTPENKEAFRQAARKDYMMRKEQDGLTGYATGTSFAPGGTAIVGERGPEIVNLPRGSQVIPNHQLGDLGGGQISVNVNVGMYAGSEMEKRKVAEALFEALKDVAGAKNTTVARMMGA